MNFGACLTTSPASIGGVVFNDLNGNGVQDTGEPGLGGVVVYLDLNNSGVFASSDPSTDDEHVGPVQLRGPRRRQLCRARAQPGGDGGDRPVAVTGHVHDRFR